MSIATAKAELANVLRTITEPWAFAKVYDKPREATSIGEFPCAILSLTPGADHRWGAAADDLARHDYSITIWVLVGMRATGLPELVDRAEAWIVPIADALAAALTLNDTVEWIGAGESTTLFTYQMGPIAWASEQQNYFGLRIVLPVTEKPVQTIGG